MSVEDCITAYKQLGGKVFGHPRLLPNKGVMWHKFNWRRLRDVIEEVVQEHHTKTRQFHNTFPSEEDFCRTYVVHQDSASSLLTITSAVVAYASNGTATTPYLFRTYQTYEMKERVTTRNKVRNPGEALVLDITLVGRATSAAPGYFPPVKIRSGKGTVKFKDGGFGTNNPSDEIRRDVKHLHGNTNSMLGPFISIGTGCDDVKMFAGDGAFLRIREVWKNAMTAFSLPSLTTGTHENMLGAAFDGNRRVFPYHRFDGGERLGKVKMDSWAGHKYTGITGRDATPGCKTLEEIEVAVAMYLRNSEVSKELDAAAELLVKRRRFRMRDKSNWDRYASASWYQCPFDGCKDKRRHDTLRQFREHVVRHHQYQVSPEVLGAALAESRRCWVYPERRAGPSAQDTKEKGKKVDRGQGVARANGVV
jgi:hypothetical protein